MISAVASRLSKAMAGSGIILSDEIPIYEYGMFMFLSYTFFFCISILIGIIIKILPEAVIFYLTFCIIREYAGGIHAKKEKSCMVLTTISIFISEIAIKFLIVGSRVLIAFLIILLSAFSLLIFSPLQNANKKYTINDIQHFRRVTTSATVVLSLIAFSTFHIVSLRNIGVAISIGMGLAAMLFLLGKISEKIKRVKHN